MEPWKAETLIKILEPFNLKLNLKPCKPASLGSWCKLGSLPRDIATLERWRALELVLLEPWNLRALKPLKPATLDSWSPVTLEPWNPATSESCNPGALESRNLRPFASLEPLCLSWAVVTLRTETLKLYLKSCISGLAYHGLLGPWTLEPGNLECWNDVINFRVK